MSAKVLFSRILGNPMALSGIILIGLIVTGVAFAPEIAPHDPLAVNLEQRLLGPNPTFPLGTDELGRCVLSRLLYGGRLSLWAGFYVSVIILAVGVAVGMVCGLAGGWVESLFMRVVDLLLALPPLILALAVAGIMGPSLAHVMTGVACIYWAVYARLVRGLVLSAREKEYVEAAQILGTRGFRLVVRYILPQVLPGILVLASFEMKWVILAISGLSFLGLGAQPPTPEWGSMLNEARVVMRSSPHLMMATGGAIFLTVLGFNLLGEGLRDAFQVKEMNE
jgi:ABC-type dipeptide/oligopeptide/nickel transport system permease subunit